MSVVPESEESDSPIQPVSDLRNQPKIFEFVVHHIRCIINSTRAHPAGYVLMRKQCFWVIISSTLIPVVTEKGLISNATHL